MLSGLTEAILQGIRDHGIWYVIMGVAIETIVVPLPSPLIVMFAGSVLIDTSSVVSVLWGALWISVIAGAAQTIGSFLLYLIGYWGGKPVISKYHKFIGVSWGDIEAFQKKFGKGRKEAVTLFILRALPIMPLSVISGVAGVMEMDTKKYTIATFLGTIPRDFILALGGVFLTEAYITIAKYLDNAETIMTGILILLIVAYIIGHKMGVFERMRKNILK